MSCDQQRDDGISFTCNTVNTRTPRGLGRKKERSVLNMPHPGKLSKKRWKSFGGMSKFLFVNIPSIAESRLLYIRLKCDYAELISDFKHCLPIKKQDIGLNIFKSLYIYR